MPWNKEDSKRHTKAAKTDKQKRQWSKVANEALARTGDEGIAVRSANAAVRKGSRSNKR